jgi:hypothetical protein
MVLMSNRTESPAWRYVRRYGPEVPVADDDEFGTIYAPQYCGILHEHLHAAGLEAHRIASGRQIVAIDGKVVDVLCSSLIPITTEDGPATGRCGIPLRDEAWACPGHQSEMEAWMAMSELEKADWERRHDEERNW